MNKRVYGVALVTLLAAVGCKQDVVKDAGEPDVDKDEVAAPAEDETPEPAEGGGHFTEAVAARDAVIAGDLEGAKEAGEALSTVAARPAWEAGGAPMVAAVSRLKGAETLEAAAGAVGEVGAACGLCHGARGLAPRAPASPMPGTEEDPKGHMQRHAWAAERLWGGLVGPDQEAWGAGVSGLGELPLGAEGTSREGLPEGYQRLAEEVHGLGKPAAAARGQRERGEVFGRLLATCGGCHEGR